MIIIPAIDLYKRKVVRLEQGNFDKIVFYEKKVKDLAALFSSYNIERLHVVDLDGAKRGYTNSIDIFAKIKKHSKCKLEVGGGIRSLKTVESVWAGGLSSKEDKIMIGSLPFFNKQEFLSILSKYRSSILITVDVLGDEIKLSGWQKKASTNLFDYMKEMQELGLNDFLVTQIKKDGMLSGMDIDLYRDILKKFPSISLTASGGLSSIEELYKLKKMKVSGVILGKAFYEERITLDELKKEGFI